jgi:hypothetical protein
MGARFNTQDITMAGPEFVFLNDQAVRVTSLRHDDAHETVTLVCIARGSGDRDLITRLLETRPLTLRIPDEGERQVVPRDVDMRSTGEGQRAIYRFSITFVPDGSHPETETTPTLTIEDRLTSLEQRLDQIVALLEDIKAGRK